MAIGNSGLYVANMVDVFDATQLAIDLSLVTHRGSLISNTHTPNYDTDVTWNTTNEVAGTGWATPGVLLSAISAGATSLTPTNTISPTGTQMYDGNDVAVASTTLTGARALRIYADALAGDNLIVLVGFGADFATVNGTFGIQWAATGIFTVDWTP